MERFSAAREHLLGQSPRRSFGKLPSTRNSSDVDFNDVFGGPPRRSSLHEWRSYSSQNSISSSSSFGGGRGGGGEEAAVVVVVVEESSTSSNNNPCWGLSSDKPVFGEENVNRRSNPSSEFFDDIFRGGNLIETSVSTPTKPITTRDPFYSSPSSSSSSRVLSPARSFQPQSEPFGGGGGGGGSSIPLSLSLHTKLAKGMDQAFAGGSGSPLSKKGSGSSGLGYPSSPSASRGSTLVVEGRKDSINDAHPFYGKSTSSRELYLNREDSSEAIKSDKQEIEDNGKMGLSSSEAINTSTIQFHFSIYRWVSKGAPLAMPLRRRNNIGSKGRENTEKIENEFPATFLQRVEQTSVSDNILAGDEAIPLECENQDKTSALNTKKNTIVSSRSLQEAVSAKPESEPISNSASDVGKRASEPGARIDIGLHEFINKGIPVPMEESYQMNLKRKEELNKQGDGKTVKQAGAKGDAVGKIDASVANIDRSKKVKKPSGKRSIFILSGGISNNLPDSSASSEDKLARNKVKGKVKDFVQIFNQEAPSKLTNVRKTGVQDEDACKLDDRGRFADTKTEGEEKETTIKNQGTFVDASAMEEKDMEELQEPDIALNKASCNTYDTSYEGTATSTSYPETMPDIFTAVGNMEESHFEDLQANCLVEELPPEQNKSSEASQLSEEIQASDAKIRKWSNGKQGNIRSLLSTLQYVLWPESGWKPVPLMDIIEGSSVKKAYNKALLCLHPDKLQQKGAAPHQKYIAEKVFDILQEAWTHFNLVGGSF